MNWLKEQIEWLKSIFSEESKKGSMKRIIMAFVTISFVVSYMKVMIVTQSLLDIPMNWMLLIAGMLGLGIADNYVKK